MSAGVREEDKDRIVNSLETILQALLGNLLGTIRRSVDDLGADMERRIDALREESKGSLNVLRAELLSSDESVRHEVSSAVETRTNSMAEDHESRIEAAKRDLDAKLEEMADRLEREQLSLSERLDGTERELTGQEAVSGRLTEVLESLGSAFGSKSAPPEKATVLPPSTQVSVPDASPDHDGVVSDVEFKFEDRKQPSEIETQPILTGLPGLTETEEVKDALDRVTLAASKPSDSE